MPGRCCDPRPKRGAGGVIVGHQNGGRPGTRGSAQEQADDPGRDRRDAAIVEPVRPHAECQAQDHPQPTIGQRRGLIGRIDMRRLSSIVILADRLISGGRSYDGDEPISGRPRRRRNQPAPPAARPRGRAARSGRDDGTSAAGFASASPRILGLRSGVRRVRGSRGSIIELRHGPDPLRMCSMADVCGPIDEKRVREARSAWHIFGLDE